MCRVLGYSTSIPTIATEPEVQIRDERGDREWTKTGRVSDRRLYGCLRSDPAGSSKEHSSDYHTKVHEITREHHMTPEKATFNLQVCIIQKDHAKRFATRRCFKRSASVSDQRRFSQGYKAHQRGLLYRNALGSRHSPVVLCRPGNQLAKTYI